MIALMPLDLPDAQGRTGYRSIPAIYGRASTEGRPLPLIGAAGTGGFEGEAFHRLRMGYQPFAVVEVVKHVEGAPYAKLMQEVKAGFGRTMTRLPEVFGVSRQTLYNWLDGETPKLAHQEKLRQLADASRVFQELGFKPTSAALDRTVSKGKSMLQLVAEGTNGHEAAKKLVRIVQRSNESRIKLDEALGDRRARPDVMDIGTPSLDEDT